MLASTTTASLSAYFFNLEYWGQSCFSIWCFAGSLLVLNLCLGKYLELNSHKQLDLTAWFGWVCNGMLNAASCFLVLTILARNHFLFPGLTFITAMCGAFVLLVGIAVALREKRCDELIKIFFVFSAVQLTMGPIVFVLILLTWHDVPFVIFPAIFWSIAVTAIALAQYVPLQSAKRFVVNNGRLGKYSANTGLCPECDYDLSGSIAGGKSRCPECGSIISEEIKRFVFAAGDKNIT